MQCPAGARPRGHRGRRAGRAIARSRLPEGAEWLEATIDGRHLLGSPIALRQARRTEGVVAAQDGGIEGWAWHPADPDTDPVLTVRGHAGVTLTITATDTDMPALSALARPRRFALPAARLTGLRGPLAVTGRDGQHLMGSPLDPAAELSSAAAIARQAARNFPCCNPAAARTAGAARRAPAELRGAPATARWHRAGRLPSWCRCIAASR